MEKKQDIKDESEPKATDDTKQKDSGEEDYGLDPDKEGKESEGVVVSEKYQQMAHKMTHKATKHHLDHLRGRINNREDELRKEETKDKPKPKVTEYSSDGGY